jgi:hypothetical protein
MAARPHMKIDWDADATVGVRLLGWETPWKNIQQNWRKQLEGRAKFSRTFDAEFGVDGINRPKYL